MPFIIGTAGHIDHGKTSLIKALTGMDTDRLKEEKERGISIDLGFAYLDLPDGTKAGIVDVPGHERFIRNMLAGATGFDMVLFAIAADDGIMPQTKEHLDIMHLLGISNGLFVITKSDLVDERQVNTVIADVKGLIHDTCLKDSPIIPVSSATGFGIDNLRKLISTEAQKVLSKPAGGFFRLPVDRSFSIKGFGTVVTGTVASGTAQKNDEVVIISGKHNIHNPCLIHARIKKVKIRGMQSHSQETTSITVGQRAAINLSGVSHTDIARGDMLASPDLDAVSSCVDVLFEFLPVETDTRLKISGTSSKSVSMPVKNHSTLKLHHLTGETLATISFYGVKEGGSGAHIFGRIKLKTPMAMMRNDRFILRDPSTNATVGGGKVLLPYLPVLRQTGAKKRKSVDGEQSRIDSLRSLQVLDSQDMKKVLLSILSDKDTFGADRHKVRLMLNLSEKGLNDIIDGLLSPSLRGIKGEVAVIGELLFLKEKIKEVEQRIVEFINKYHREKPGDIGVDEDYIIKGSGVRGQGSGIKSETFKIIIANLISSGRIAKTGNTFCLPSHKPETQGKEKDIENAVLSLFQNRGFNPLKMDEVLQLSYKLAPESIGQGNGDIKNVLQLLIKKGMIVRVAEDIYTSKTVLDEAKDKLVNWISDKGKIKAAEFRDILGCGRKFAIELLEHFDKEKITLRSGDYRVLRKR